MLKNILVPALAIAAAFSLTASAEAKPGGCLKYGAAGAVAGHMAHHGVMGAVAGCALGIHKRREYKREMRMERSSGARAPIAPQSGAHAY